MNKEQEYIKFWASVIDKMEEVGRDYNNLSYENKRRVDSVKDKILQAHTFIDAIQIIRSQINY
ncbi:MAG: hypothetical protein IKB93_00115 [Clostridia bacterium]|nr:hypothetical protein [Clostridia bacterium]